MGTRAAERGRIMHIRNTLMLHEVEVSEPCLEELPRASDFAIVRAPFEIEFDAAGNLAPV
jgi:hypothetical protein